MKKTWKALKPGQVILDYIGEAFTVLAIKPNGIEVKDDQTPSGERLFIPSSELKKGFTVKESK